jgi:hypothetical protein
VDVNCLAGGLTIDLSVKMKRPQHVPAKSVEFDSSSPGRATTKNISLVQVQNAQRVLIGETQDAASKQKKQQDLIRSLCSWLHVYPQ